MKLLAAMSHPAVRKRLNYGGEIEQTWGNILSNAHKIILLCEKHTNQGNRR